MTQPATGPADAASVKAQGTITGDRLDEFVEAVVEAVNAQVRRWPVALAGDLGDPDVEPPAAWPANITLGANMLATRLVRRRNSPTGVETFAEAGPVYVSRTDPDVAQLLEIGNYSRPEVG